MALTIDRARPLVLIIALALAAGLFALFPAGFAALDARLGDLGWRLAATEHAENRLLIVDIDEKSLAELGPWPWPRERLAALADQIGKAGAAWQVWDIVLDTPRPGDAALAAALQRHRAVLAAAFALPGQGEAVDAGQLDPGASVGHLPCTPPWPQAHGQRAPAQSLAGLPVGHIAPRVDADGLVRALPSHICRQGLAWPALPLAGYLAATGAKRPTLKAGTGLLAPPWQLVAEGLPEAIPLGHTGELMVPYTRAPQAFVALSAADLLAERTPPSLLAGRIVLVSSTAFGLADVVATPLAGAQGGVLVHAELLSGLLDAHLPHPPRATNLLQVIFALTAAGLLWLLARARPAYGWLPAGGLALAGLLLALQIVLQWHASLLLGLTAPALAALLAGLGLGMLEHIRLGSERSRLLAHLASYLPTPVALRLAALRPQDDINAEIAQASVLVADLRNFSAWSEHRPPAEVAALLHRFLAAAVDIVEAEGGQVEALEGDAILAIWNGLLPCPDHAVRASRAAQALLARVSAELPAADPDSVPPPLALGIGLDAGPVLVGSLGPRRRRQHLALGLPVTRAVRLAAMTSDLSWPILVGPGLVAHLAHPPATWQGRLQHQGEFLLEGLVQPCAVHALA